MTLNKTENIPKSKNEPNIPITKTMMLTIDNLSILVRVGFI